MASTAGQDYPRSYAQLRSWFNEDWKCLDYLDWPNGFACPTPQLRERTACARPPLALRWLRPAGLGDRRYDLLHGTRTPRTVRFVAAWHLVNSKVGISAPQQQREMWLGPYQTAWAVLHRYRSVRNAWLRAAEVAL